VLNGLCQVIARCEPLQLCRTLQLPRVLHLGTLPDRLEDTSLSSHHGRQILPAELNKCSSKRHPPPPD
jgi:hypothetical protein